MGDRQIGLLTSLLVAALLAAAPRPGQAVRALSAPIDPADPTGPVLAAIGLLAWALAGWLALGASLVLASRLPGLAGHLANDAAARSLPAAVRRSLEITLGVSLVVGTVGAAPALATTVEPGGGRAPATAAGLSLDWPAAGQASETPAAGPRGPTPDPAGANSPTPISPTVADRPATGQAGERPSPARSEPASAVRPVTIDGDGVVVQPGDTLWGLATRELAAADIRTTAAAVAARWPVWWEANRTAIGDDPHLLRPGTELTPPTG